MPANIFSTVSGQGPVVILIHGLFGMGSNLGALARSLHDSFEVYSIDLPNHGRSDWIAPSGIPTMADAVVAWMDRQGIQSASFVGHSLGGKVAMEVALRHPERVSALVAADIAPVAYPAHHADEFAALEAVAGAQCQSRAEARDLMCRHLDDDTVVQFLLKSLTRDARGVYVWRFNLNEILKSYDAIRAGIEGDVSYTGPVLFIKGGDSSYVLEQHREKILALFPTVILKVMPGCGHWLHAQQPRLFNRLVGRFLEADTA